MAGITVLPTELQTQMQLDPRISLAQLALKQGTDASPAKGGWAEAAARALSGILGGYEAKSVRDEYAGTANDISSILSSGLPGAPGTPTASAATPAAGVTIPASPVAAALSSAPTAVPATVSPPTMGAGPNSPMGTGPTLPPPAVAGGNPVAAALSPQQAPAPQSPAVAMPTQAAGPTTPAQKMMDLGKRLYKVSPEAGKALMQKAMELDATQQGDMAKLGMQRNADGSMSAIPGFADVTGQQEAAKAKAHQAIDIDVNAHRAHDEAQYKPTTVFVNGQERIVPATALADGSADGGQGGAPGAGGDAAAAGGNMPGFAGKPLPLTPLGTEIGDEATAAGKLNQQLDTVEHLVGQITPGAWANNKYNLIKGVNSGLATAGLPQIEPDKVASAEELNKIVIQMASNATKQLGSREAAQVFEKQIQAQPGIGMTQGGAQGIINTMRLVNQRSLDQADAYGKYGYQNEATFRPQFEKENPGSGYSAKSLAAYNPYLDDSHLPPVATQAAQAALKAGYSKVEIGQMLKAKGYK